MKIASKTIPQSQWINEKLHPSWQQNFEVDQLLVDTKTSYQHLQIFENATFGKVMMLDGVTQTTERDEFIYHEMLAHIPMVAHGSATSVLVIGGGDGGIIREVLKHPKLSSVTMVEIDAGVVEYSKRYMPSLSQGAFENNKVKLHIADAAEFVKTTTDKFDVIITDSTDPMGPGESLFTESFYSDCKKCLKPGGIMVTQSGVPFMQPQGIKNMQTMLCTFFESVNFYLMPVPTYIGGTMVIGFACDTPEYTQQSLQTLNEKSAYLNEKTKYYTPEIHQYSFSIPPFIQKLLK